MSDTERRLKNAIRQLRADKARLQSEVAALTDALASATRRRRRPSKREEMSSMVNGPFPPAQPEAPEAPPAPGGEPDGL
jgi:uncharacterized protein YlxW (UPF0749 family)